MRITGSRNSPSRDIQRAIRRGADFLQAHRADDGLWHDFDTYAGDSDEWVSGFVLYALAGVPQCEAARHSVAQALLDRQRKNGGWGYNARIPADADSTAWVLRSLLGLPLIQPHRVRSALDFLCRHQKSDGGFATFLDPGAIGSVISEQDESALRGWTSSHLCVSANVVLAMIEWGIVSSDRFIGNAVEYLSSQRGADGLWYAYWWRGPYLASYLAALALLHTRQITADELAEVAQRIAARQEPDGGWTDQDDEPSNAFATALSLLVIAMAGIETHSATERAVQWLIAAQDNSGGWPATPILRIPDAHIVNPDAGPTSRHSARPGTNVIAADEQGIFTTAAVVKALSACLNTWKT